MHASQRPARRPIGHRPLAAVLASLVLAQPIAARAQDATNVCERLAIEILQSHRETPPIEPESIEQLVTWRASRCATPPSGAGNVVALCQAKTRDGGSLFYWKKRADDKTVNGSLSCK